MKIVLAPDSFKECLDAPSVSRILADEIRRLRPAWTVIECPLSDGGECFVDIVTTALEGARIPVRVSGPLGEPVDAFFGKAGETSVIDAASACGLSLVPLSFRNPWKATSRGVGELMVAAYRSGCRKLLVGLGGTATCDGGEGMMQAEGMEALRGNVSVDVLCDVDNPFVGPEGTARVFAPQKGADNAMVEQLEARMQRQALRILEATGTDVSGLPGAGAAGGLAGALAAWFGARLSPGIDTVLRYIGFESKAEGADWILTGEGCSDRQTLSGKVPTGVLRHAGNTPVALVSGRIRDREALLEAGFATLVEVTPLEQPLSEAVRPEVVEMNLRAAVERWLTLLRP